MRNRLIAAVAAAAALALAAPAALAGPAPATMDGKKVKELVLKANGGLQSHDDDNTQVLGGPERVDCEAPRCAILPFVYNPAKGVKDGLMFTANWSSPASDIDLYVAQIGKRDTRTEVSHCGGTSGTSEKIYVAAGDLKPGKTYALIIDFFRSVNEDVTAKVAFGADTVAKHVPTEYDGQFPGTIFAINCTL